MTTMGRTYQPEVLDRLPINLVLSRITHYLLGLAFPAPKPNIVRYAKSQKADPGSVRLLELLPAKKYQDIKILRRDTSRIYRKLIAQKEGP